MVVPPGDRRRAKRLLVQMPIVLQGTDAAGRYFFDRAEVVSIDPHGARIQTRFQLKAGTEVQVKLPTEQEAKCLRVVWCGEPGGFYEGTVGVEFAEPNESWSLETLRAR